MARPTKRVRSCRAHWHPVVERTRADLMQTLCANRMTVAELSVASGYSEPCVTKHMRWMNEHRMVHICSWRSHTSAVYAYGFKRNAYRPAKTTNAQRRAKYRATHAEAVAAAEERRLALARIERGVKRQTSEQVGGMWSALIVPGKALPLAHGKQKMLAT